MSLYVFYQDILFCIVYILLCSILVSFLLLLWFVFFHIVVFLVYVVLLLVVLFTCLVLFIFRCVLCRLILEFLDDDVIKVETCSIFKYSTNIVRPKLLYVKKHNRAFKYTLNYYSTANNATICAFNFQS
jgi:hypothetical protein